MQSENKDYWDRVYSEYLDMPPSSFARFVLPNLIGGSLYELGCGRGRDTNFFIKSGIDAVGVDASYESFNIVKKDVVDFMCENKCREYLYTRFFWHAIPRSVQLEILNWVTNFLFIEARTTEDKPKDVCGIHKRWLVSVPDLVQDLKDNGFEIQYLKEGYGMSVFEGEDPHLVRVIAVKK